MNHYYIGDAKAQSLKLHALEELDKQEAVEAERLALDPQADESRLEPESVEVGSDLPTGGTLPVEGEILEGILLPKVKVSRVQQYILDRQLLLSRIAKVSFLSRLTTTLNLRAGKVGEYAIDI